MRGGKEGMRGDKPGQPDVLFQGAVKDWRDHLTKQRWKIGVQCSQKSLSILIFFYVFVEFCFILFVRLFWFFFPHRKPVTSSPVIVRTATGGAVAPHKRLTSILCARYDVPVCVRVCESHVDQARGELTP